MSLYGHSLLIVGAVLAVVTIATSSWIAVEQNRSLTVELESRLSALARFQAAALADTFWDLNRESAEKILKGGRTDPDFHSARAVMNDGGVFAEILGEHDGVTPLVSRKIDVAIALPGTAGKVRRLGFVELTFSLARLQSLQRGALWKAAGFGLLQLLAVLIGTALAMRWIIVPVEAIRQRLVLLSKGETDPEIPAIDRQDQIGDMARAVASLRDSLIEIDRLRAEEARHAVDLKQAHDEAQAANLAKSDFLSSMSHELRTPMNAILGFAQLLESNPNEPPSEPQKDQIHQILKSGDHLLGLIDQVLELSRIESGNISLSFESVAPEAVINECVEMVRKQANDKDINVKFSSPRLGYPPLWTDGSRFRQVLLNLLSNAVKYNRTGGEVAVALELAGNNHLRISVTDTGLGIPVYKQKKLFEPFNRLGREAGDIEGTGIGLTITKQIVELMHGNIGFESEDGKGSTFWIEISVDGDTPDGTDELATPNISEHGVIADSNNEIMNSSGVILYIEDNPANLQLMEAIIKRVSNIAMRTAHNAELGLVLARDIHPDLILMDINLPGIDGITALKMLREDDGTKDIPVIAISAAAMPHEIEHGKAAGFEDYLTKPIKVPIVLDAITKFIG